jgi:MYXO-CTERM domain-containing protein
MRTSRRVLGLAPMLLGVASLLALPAGCASPGDEEYTDDGSRRGELAMYIADDPSGSRTTYFLRDTAGAETKLLFDKDPGLDPDTRLKVWGAESAEGLRVTSFLKLVKSGTAAATERFRSQIINGTPFAPRSFAFIMVDIGGGINRTADDVMQRMITAPDSIRNYYLGDSYGLQDITNVVIPTIPYSPNGCDTSPMTTALRAMVDAQGGPFQHYLWYYGSRNSSCSWSGLASVGTPDSPQRNTWYNASTGCVVLVQEPGHNFGMQHSSSLTCPGAAFADNPNDCDANEYGDPYDPMGGGCRHMNAWQKAYQGWFSGCNGVRVTNTGTFTLVPFETACNGVQFLQIKAPKPRPFMRPADGGGGATTENLDYYYLELRTPVDFDGMLGNRSALSARVLVHVAADLLGRTKRGIHPFLLDMTPATGGSSGLSDAALAAGATFTDPAGGLTIKVDSVSNAGASITVTYTNGTGGPMCLDGTAFTPPGPGMESCAASPTGAGGTTGAAGTGGGGRGGTTGMGGRGGTTGMAGRGGTTGAAGMIGIAGRGGTTGAAGTNAEGGTTGAAGAPITGDAGSTGTAGTSGIRPPMPVTGGCACDVADGAPNPMWLLGLAFGLRGVRRYRRSSRPGSD